MTRDHTASLTAVPAVSAWPSPGGLGVIFKSFSIQHVSKTFHVLDCCACSPLQSMTGRGSTTAFGGKIRMVPGGHTAGTARRRSGRPTRMELEWLCFGLVQSGWFVRNEAAGLGYCVEKEEDFEDRDSARWLYSQAACESQLALPLT